MRNYREALVIGDLHFRDDIAPGYLNIQAETILRLTQQKHYDYVIFMGDVLEHRNSKSTVLLKFYELLASIKAGEIIIIRGNHDTVSKTNTTDTVLSVFRDRATIIADITTLKLFHTVVDFVPHFEDEKIIKNFVKKRSNVVFGHWGIDGIANSKGFTYESKVKRTDFNNLVFLGHLHTHSIKDNVHVIGTPYSTNYSEANQHKYYYEMRFESNGTVTPYPKKMKFGIKHISAFMGNIDNLYRQYEPQAFYTLLRMNMDDLDEFKERELREKIQKKYKYNILDIRFDNLLSKHSSRFHTNAKLFNINDGILEEYIEQNSTIFEKDELRSMLKEIHDY